MPITAEPEAMPSDGVRERALPIGSGIRDRRRRLGLTLKELAVASGLSVPFLSQIERDLASPSLVSLAAVARALGVDMNYFVGAPASGQIVRRAAAPEHLTLDGGNVVYTRLSGRHEERKLEALLIEVPPGTRSPPARRDGEGFWYLLDGEVEMWVGQEHFVLEATARTSISAISTGCVTVARPPLG